MMKTVEDSERNDEKQQKMMKGPMKMKRYHEDKRNEENKENDEKQQKTMRIQEEVVSNRES